MTGRNIKNMGQILSGKTAFWLSQPKCSVRHGQPHTSPRSCIAVDGINSAAELYDHHHHHHDNYFGKVDEQTTVTQECNVNVSRRQFRLECL